MQIQFIQLLFFEKACKCYKVTDWPLALVLSGAEEEEVANLYDMGMSDDELRVALTEWSLSVFDRERVESIGGKWEEYSFISLEARKLLDLALSRHLDGGLYSLNADQHHSARRIAVFECR